MTDRSQLTETATKISIVKDAIPEAQTHDKHLDYQYA